MKRKLYNIYQNSNQDPTFLSSRTRSKKIKIEFIEYIPPKRQYLWVSATDIKNYINKDPLVDWLKLTKKTGHGEGNGECNRENKINCSSFTEFITQKGCDFEKEIVNYINKRIPVVSVSTEITDDSCQKTIDLMKKGIPILHSVPFRNYKKHTRGIIDFLVRSDYLNIFTGENPLEENLRLLPAPKLQSNYHYIVIDVKFSTLPLRADGIHLLNSGNYPFYKSQLWIYTEGIGEIQGYTSRYSYILGRRYKFTSNGDIHKSFNCLDKLGTIDYLDIDILYKSKTHDAMVWLKDLKKNGKKWSVSPPSRPELYPNMCIDSGIWNSQKEKIATDIGDITQIWYCGIKNRQKAIENGITSWRDSKCSSKNIGIGGSRSIVIDKIININKQDKIKILPEIVLSNLYNWKDTENEIFVDFETFIDIFSPLEDIPLQNRSDKIFMIGVYYKKGENWDYKNFIAKESTYEEEYRIMDNFASFVKKQNNPKIWYWYADQNLWTRAEERQFRMSDERERENIASNWKLQNWADLCKIFREEPIVIKGCFKFGLKEVARAMKKQGLVETEIESNCHSGLDAAIMAWKVYKEKDNPINDPVIKDIAKYNEFDVKILWEIILYLRKNHLLN